MVGLACPTRFQAILTNTQEKKHFFNLKNKTKNPRNNNNNKNPQINKEILITLCATRI